MHGFRWGRYAGPLFIAVLFAGAPAFAQMPDHFTNLQVLPKDIPRADLMATMRGFAFALGVRCEHCHVQTADHQMNFAADDNVNKKTARIMVQMVAAINRDYVSTIGTAKPVHVECVTCHRGLTQPRTLNAVISEALEKDGVAGAAQLYRDLRTRYYGSGEYDFGETPLNQLTESLLAQKRPKEATAIVEMNFEANHPQSVWSYHLLAMSHQANGETAKAIADYRKVLELHPDDSWAKQQLDSLTAK